MSFTSWINDRWDHISFGLQKNLADIGNFLAPIQKQLAPLEKEALQSLISVATPIIVNGLKSGQKPIDVLHSAGNALVDHAPTIGVNLAVESLQTIANTVYAAHSEAALGQALPPTDSQK